MIVSEVNWGSPRATQFERDNAITQRFNTVTEATFNQYEDLASHATHGVPHAYQLVGFILP
jgi:hypothetical protein